MSDVVAISAETLSWLQRLAHADDGGNDGWDHGDPCSTFEQLLTMGMVEYRPAAFRLSAIGWWTLQRAVAEGVVDGL